MWHRDTVFSSLSRDMLNHQVYPRSLYIVIYISSVYEQIRRFVATNNSWNHLMNLLPIWNWNLTFIIFVFRVWHHDSRWNLCDAFAISVFLIAFGLRSINDATLRALMIKYARVVYATDICYWYVPDWCYFIFF